MTAEPDFPLGSMGTHNLLPPNLQIRKAKSKDVAYITNSWLHSYRHSVRNKGVPKKEYYYYHHKKLEDVLPRATTLVLVNENDPDQILGYICYERASNDVIVIHYIMLKGIFRGNGLLWSLLDILEEHEKPKYVLYTHDSKPWHDITRSHPERFKNYRYNPYWLDATLSQGWARAREIV